jgi:hypothetical protein
MAASDILSRSKDSSASDRLAASGKPTGKKGDPALTIKLRNKFTEYRSENPETDKQWESWLDENGYGLGDNNHVYKK